MSDPFKYWIKLKPSDCVPRVLGCDMGTREETVFWTVTQSATGKGVDLYLTPPAEMQRALDAWGET